MIIVNKNPTLFLLTLVRGEKGDTGAKGDKGDTGEQGVSVTSITKTSTVGSVDTYQVNLSDGTSAGTFTVTNGEVTGDVIAPAYSSTTAYKIGNLLTYLGKQYEVTGDDGVAPPVGTLPTDTHYFTERPVSEIIDMIKAGTIPVGLSDMAKNLTPYSEDSGAIQDTPFISQETGTANNSVIVTTGDKAKQLEKLGNAVVVNQPIKNGNFATTNNWNAVGGTFSVSNNIGAFIPSQQEAYLLQTVAITNGHKYLAHISVKLTSTTNADKISVDLRDGTGAKLVGKAQATTNWQDIMAVIEAVSSRDNGYLRLLDSRASDWDTIQVSNAYIFDITSWDSDIITDLATNPSHFSWYYNGELTYNAGEIKHGDGVKLVCTRGRNLFNKATAVVGYLNQDGTINSTQTAYRTSDFILVTPNVSYWLNKTDSIRGKQYDKNKQPLNTTAWDTGASSNDRYFATMSDCVYVRFSYAVAYEDSQCLTPYYTEQQGGEGYGLHYDYEEPDIIDTGSEQLGAFDKKTPDGVITRASLNANLYELYWRKDNNYWYTLQLPTWLNNTNAKSNKLTAGGSSAGQPTDASKWYTSGSGYFEVYAPNAQSSADVQTLLAGAVIEYKSDNPTTEQGSSFRQYAGINDYGIMYWLNANDELVSIPQGCKIQYPVNYKGFIDDAYMYTNGDVTALAKNESITDTALNARGYYKMQDLLTAFGANGMVGGTLRQLLAEKESLDFNNTTCVDLSTLTFSQYTTGSSIWKSDSLVGLINPPASDSTLAKVLSSNLKTVLFSNWNGYPSICVVATGRVWVYLPDSGSYTPTQFSEALKGVLLAYEKAST